MKETSRLLNQLGAVLLPASIFWGAYMNYHPENLLWWCEVVCGLWVFKLYGKKTEEGKQEIAEPIGEIIE